MITYEKNAITFAEFWYDEDLKYQGTDVVRIMHRSQAVENKKYRAVYTSVIDLRQNDDVIYQSMKRQTRQFLRRASEQDCFLCESVAPDSSGLEEFGRAYDQFAVARNLPKIDAWILNTYARQGALDISLAVEKDGSILTWLVYYKDPGHARALYSCSNYRENPDISYRQLVGRANRYLHWQDMLRFKAQGISVYDLGGWYEGSTDAAKRDINQFKEGFGGEIVKAYLQEYGVTPKGNLYLYLRARRNALKKSFASLKRSNQS